VQGKPAIGRFAPSLTGGLHFGSLVCAVASYLDIKSIHGQWILRLDDLDYLRTTVDAEQKICNALIQYGFKWDYLIKQSEQILNYNNALQQLHKLGILYGCDCSRKRLRTLNIAYDDHCRNKKLQQKDTALRIRSDINVQWFDSILGKQEYDHLQLGGDFIVRRKDDIIGYQLATVIDDIEMAVTHVLRGADLLQSSARQLVLFQLLKQQPPQFLHIPVVVDQQGCKLSKQAKAPEIATDNQSILQNLYLALQFLNQNPPKSLIHSTLQTIWQWAFNNWQRAQISKQLQLPIPTL